MSWHRSPDDLVEDFDLFGSPDVSWSPSEVAEFERHYFPDESDENFWRCKSCSSASWRDDGKGQYACMACGGKTFYDIRFPASTTVDHGIWTFTPFDSPSNSGSPISPPRDFADYARSGRDSRVPHGPDDPGSRHEAKETPESETGTSDPSVDPVTLAPYRRRRRKRYTTAQEDTPNELHAHSSSHGMPHRAPVESDLMHVLRQLLDEKRKKDETSSWTSTKGPMPGMKWRGGGTSSASQMELCLFRLACVLEMGASH